MILSDFQVIRNLMSMSYKIFENKDVIKKIKPFFKINFLCKIFSIIYLFFWLFCYFVLIFYYFCIFLLFYYFLLFFIIYLFFYYIFFVKCSKIHSLFIIKKLRKLEKCIINFLKKKKAKSKSIKVNEMRISKKMKKKV